MQHREYLVEDIGDRRVRFGARRPLDAALKHRLGEFEMPVAKDAPGEAIGRVGGVVEAKGFDGAGGLVHRLGGLAENPAVELAANGGGIEAGDAPAAVHFGEARGVPQLGRKIAIAFDAGGRELDVAALRRHRRQREAQGVGAVAVDKVQGVR